MPYRIAGIDVHKKKLAVVAADVEVEEEYRFERRWYGSNQASPHCPNDSHTPQAWLSRTSSGSDIEPRDFRP